MTPKITTKANAPIIDIKGLSLAYERDGRANVILSDLDLRIARGQFVVIVGESGVGKSTLLRVLIGLARPSGGTVSLNTDPTIRTPMALVFQDARLLPWRKVIDNVAFGLEHRHRPEPRFTRARWILTALQLLLTGHAEGGRFRGEPRPPSKADRMEKAHEMLALVGLRDLGSRWPHQLSGGQRQRVALARALAVDPDVLLMDEPFSALDSFTREGLQDEVQRIKAKTGKTVLFVTHDIDEAVYLADRVVVLAGSPGRVAADVRIDAPRPRKRRDAVLVEAARQLRAELSERSAEL